MFPRRIVCLTEETTETLYLLGEGDRVVGVSGYTVRPPEARNKPRISSFLHARYEKIEGLQPDLVLAFSDLQAGITGELIKRGYPVFTFNQRSVPEILQMIRVLGAIVGCPDKGNALADQLSGGLQRIRDDAARLSRRPRVYFEEWDDPLISGIQWVEELIEIAGGTNLPGAARRQAGEGPHRHGRPGDRGSTGHHHRIVVRQAGPSRANHLAGRLGSDPSGEGRPGPRDQVRLHPAAGTGGPHRGRLAAAAHRAAMGGVRLMAPVCLLPSRRSAATSKASAPSPRSASPRPPESRPPGSSRARARAARRRRTRC
jgi:hypothetical protein